MKIEEEMKPSLLILAKSLEEYIHHNLDIITDSDWFSELIEEKVKEQLSKNKQ